MIQKTFTEDLAGTRRAAGRKPAALCSAISPRLLPFLTIANSIFGKGRWTMMTYYDHSLGRDRVKRRYVWAAWSFAAGAAVGALVSFVL